MAQPVALGAVLAGRPGAPAAAADAADVAAAAAAADADAAPPQQHDHAAAAAAAADSAVRRAAALSGTPDSGSPASGAAAPQSTAAPPPRLSVVCPRRWLISDEYGMLAANHAHAHRGHHRRPLPEPTALERRVFGLCAMWRNAAVAGIIP